LGSLSLGFLAFLGIEAPQLHSNYIRSSVGKNVVMITSEDGRGGGTGFHVQLPSGGTAILTNAHICLMEFNGNVNVFANGATTPTRRRVIDISRNHDLCLVEGFKGFSGIPIDNGYLSTGLGSGPYLGEIMGLIGHPRLNALTLTRGETIDKRNILLLFGINLPDNRCIGINLSAKEFKAKAASTEIMSPVLAGRYTPTLDVILKELNLLLSTAASPRICIAQLEADQITNITHPGNSGSPVVNAYGKLQGVLFAGNKQVNNGYMVPLSVIKAFLAVH